MPVPISNDPITAHSRLLAGPRVASTQAPAIRQTPPITAACRYEVRIINRPAARLAKVQLTDAAPSAIPAAVGLRPIAPCT